MGFYMKLDLKLKLLIILVIPLLFVIGLSITILYGMLDDKNNLKFTKHHILEAEAISKAVHSLQIERGVTTELLANDGIDENTQQLLIAKENSNIAINEAKRVMLSCQTCTDSTSLKLLDILALRENANLLNIPLSEARCFYTKNIASLLNLIKTIPSLIEDKDNRNCIQSYSYLSSAKEELGQIRSILVQALLSRDVSDDIFILFKEHLKVYNLETQNFKTASNKDIINFYNDVFTGEDVDEMFKIINDIVKNKNKFSLTTDYSQWFQRATKSMNLLRNVEERLFNTINTLVNQKLDSIHYKLAMLLSFLGLSAIIVTILLLLIARKILFSASSLESKYDNSLLLLEQYKSTIDRGFIVSKNDKNGIISYVNDEFCKISGYTKEELIGKTYDLVIHPHSDKKFFDQMWHEVRELKKPWINEIKNITKSGATYWIKAILSPIIDKNGNILEYIAMCSDITQEKEIARYFEDQLKISATNFDYSMHISKEYEKAIDSSAILLRTDVNGIITYANDKFLEISKYSLQELVGKNHNFFNSQDEALENHQTLWQGVIKSKTKYGVDFWTKTTIVPIKNLHGEIIEYLEIRFDITEIIRHKEEFEIAAKTDSLTGCGNRLRLHYDMQENEKLSVAIFNLDNFRQINDFYGHNFGDLVIQTIASKINMYIQHDKNFKFYRLQGDEFVTLAINAPKDELLEKTKGILKLIKKKLYIGNEELLISCSAGISFEEKEHLLSTANMALKITKKSSTDFLIYSSEISLEDQYKNNLNWAKKLSSAIKENNLVTFYQPIINNSIDNRENPTKYECLIRIVDNGKIISPFFFLEVAKQTRQYSEITKTVVKQSFELFKDKHAHFSINLSVLDILEPRTTTYIFEMLKQYGIGERVIFEIVESESIDNFESIVAFIDKVKSYGCKIAIDDFGTGYSNFEYLIKLRADYLKIDGSLIKNLDKDKNALLVVSTIVEFSKKLGMKTVAEFVENREIFDIVRELGVDYSQGYYFSEPVAQI